VFEALKRWRRNKTTTVITHTLAFELGHDGDGVGEFGEMFEAQKQTGGFLLEKGPSLSSMRLTKRFTPSWTRKIRKMGRTYLDPCSTSLLI